MAMHSDSNGSKSNGTGSSGSSGLSGSSGSPGGGNARGVVAVTGSTGFVGRAVVSELLRRGWTVRALVRDRKKANEVLGHHPSLSFVDGDVLDGTSPRRLLAGAGGEPVVACVNLIGIIRETTGGQTFRRMHVQATQALVDACSDVWGAGSGGGTGGGVGGGGVGRFVQMSALGVTPDSKAAYARTKYEGEQIVRRSGLNWTIFRPSLIHGADGEFIRMMHRIARAAMAPYVFMPYFAKLEIDGGVRTGADRLTTPRVQPIAVEDVAWSIAECLGRPESVGEVYNLVGPDEMEWPEMLETLRDELPGTMKTMQPFFVPGSHAAMIAKVAKTVGLGGLLPFDEGQAWMGQEDSIASGAKASEHLGLRAKPFRATVSGYADRLNILE